MLSVVLRNKEGYRFYYVLTDGSSESGGGLTDKGELVCDERCPQKELLLRALINKCCNEFVARVTARDCWGVDLERFGFVAEAEGYVSSWDRLCLPHDCR